jgi:hypothetical protein
MDPKWALSLSLSLYLFSLSLSLGVRARFPVSRFFCPPLTTSKSLATAMISPYQAQLASNFQRLEEGLVAEK